MIREQLLQAGSMDALTAMVEDIDKRIESGVLKDVPEHTQRRWRAAAERRRIELESEAKPKAETKKKGKKK